MIRVITLLCLLFAGTQTWAQLSDEGRLTTVDVHIIEMSAIQVVACPGKSECLEETDHVLRDLRALRVRMEVFFRGRRLEAERLAINAENERLANEYERVKRKYTKRTLDFA